MQEKRWDGTESVSMINLVTEMNRFHDALANPTNVSVALHKEGAEFVSEGRRKVVKGGEVVDQGPVKDDALEALQERVEKLESQARGASYLMEVFEKLPKDLAEVQRILANG
jgi:hypothetical protein